MDAIKQALQYYFTVNTKEYKGPQLGFKAIADLYKLPRETFRRWTTGELKGFYGHLSGGKDIPKILTHEQEIKQAGHISKFAQAGFPFTPVEIRDLAFEYAMANNIEGFSQIKKTMGRKWLAGFLCFQPKLMIKTPKLLSMYCAKSANPEVVSNWFSLYKDVLNESHIGGPPYICKIDECGCVDALKPKKVVTVKKVQANQLVPAEKGQTTTAVVFVNVAGMNTKPIGIHKGTRVMEEWRNDMPEGYRLGASENGWITK